MAEKLNVIAVPDGVEIIGNREGLMGLAVVCLQLAMLPEDDTEARLRGNHYHFGETYNNAEAGSIDLTVLFKPDL